MNFLSNVMWKCKLVVYAYESDTEIWNDVYDYWVSEIKKIV